MRLFRLLFFGGGCIAFRPPDSNGEEIAVIPKGFTFHAEGMVGNHGLEIDRLLLQRQKEEENGNTELVHTAAGVNIKASHNRTSQPVALLDVSLSAIAKLNGSEVPGKGGQGATCPGTGDRWQCGDKGDAVQENAKCTVKCTDYYNEAPAVQEVTCAEGKLSPLPECKQREQCDRAGAGWVCSDAYLSKDGAENKPNVDRPCHPVCTDPNNFKLVTDAEIKCLAGDGQKGKYAIEPKCEQFKECRAQDPGQTWTCAGHAGGNEAVKHNELCKVECKDPAQVPNAPEVTCQGDTVELEGKYNMEPIACGTKEEAEKFQADHAAKQQAVDQPKTGAPGCQCSFFIVPFLVIVYFSER
jgi:hypothetical protein